MHSLYLTKRNPEKLPHFAEIPLSGLGLSSSAPLTHRTQGIKKKKKCSHNMSDSTNEDLKCPERLQSFPGVPIQEEKRKRTKCFVVMESTWLISTGFLPLSYFYSHAPRLPSNPLSLFNMNMLYVRVLWFSVHKGQDRTQDTVNESGEIHLFLRSFFLPPSHSSPFPLLPLLST